MCIGNEIDVIINEGEQKHCDFTKHYRFMLEGQYEDSAYFSHPPFENIPIYRGK